MTDCGGNGCALLECSTIAYRCTLVRSTGCQGKQAIAFKRTQKSGIYYHGCLKAQSNATVVP